MQLCLINNSFRYEIEKLIRIFLPFEKIELSEVPVFADNSVITEIAENTAKATLYFCGKVYNSVKKIERINQNADKDAELFLALAVYECFVSATNY